MILPQITVFMKRAVQYLAVMAVLAILPPSMAGADSQPASGQKMQIAQSVLDGFKKYQATIGSTTPGAFAVTGDGRHYYAWYCKKGDCHNNGNFAQKALEGCSKYGPDCYIFARQNDITVDYQVVP